MLNNYLENLKSKNVGIIVNYFSKQFLNKYYELYNIPTSNFVDYLSINNLNTIFIDNELFEVDHAWFKKEINGLLAHAKLNNIDVIIIRNTDKPIRNVLLDYPAIEINVPRYEKNNKNRVQLPVIVDETKFNPIDTVKSIDILYVSFSKILRTKGIQSLNVMINPKREEFVFDEMSRKNFLALFSKIKKAKCVYFYYVDEIDNVIIKYLEVIVGLQNSIPMYSSFTRKSENAIIKEDIELMTNIVSLIGNKQMREKFVLPNQRKLFLNHTFMAKKDLFNSDTEVKPIPTSVITSTNRKYNLSNYIQRLNSQKLVEIQATLITHGFKLTNQEEDLIYDQLNNDIDLTIISVDESQPLGFCLNKAISNVKHDYVAKMDDDDYYFDNYLIDSWISAKYSDADLVGKFSTFTYLGDSNIIISKHKNTHRKYHPFVMGATFFCKTSIMQKYMFSYLPTGEDSDFLRRIKEDKAIIYADHPYNFCIYRSGDVGDHTWKISDLEYMRNAIIEDFNKPYEFISL